MTSIFASQFGPGSPYQPISLDTGTLSVGANLPSIKKPKAPTGEQVGAKVPSTLPKSAAIGLAADASAGAGASNTANETVGSAASKRASANASISKHMGLDAQADNNAAIPVTSGASAPLTKKTSGANVGIPSPEWGMPQTKQKPNLFNQTATSPHTLAPAPAAPPKRGGFLGSLENWGSSFTNMVDHGMYSPNAGQKPVDAYEQAQYNRMNGPGSKFYFNPGATSASLTSGGVQGLSSGTSINKTTDPYVTEPSNTWNPSGNGSSLYSSGTSPNAIPGVSSSSAMASAQRQAIGMNPAYNQQQFYRLNTAKDLMQGAQESQQMTRAQEQANLDLWEEEMNALAEADAA